MGTREFRVFVLCLILQLVAANVKPQAETHPLSRINILKTTLRLSNLAELHIEPSVLGQGGETTESVDVVVTSPNPSNDDWLGVFSPANFSGAPCPAPTQGDQPLMCTAPIKYLFCNYSSDYLSTGQATFKILLVNQRSDYSVALLSGMQKPTMVAVSNSISFKEPRRPAFPRLAQGKEWNEMTVTWTSGYGIDDAESYVEYALEEETNKGRMESPAGTITYDRRSMCGDPARSVGWRDPGFIHTSFLKDLKPSRKYSYKLCHKLSDGTVVESPSLTFKSAPYPGQKSLQRVVIFGDMGKADPDGSNDVANSQPGSLQTTQQLIRDKDNIDMIFHLGNLAQSRGFLSLWDQFTSQIELIASKVPYMISSGHLDRDGPDTRSFYTTEGSGGECGVPVETSFYVPADNRAKPYYAINYGMLRFCVASTELDWREGTDQFKFIKHCLSSVDRRKQPWLIFLAHRVLGYSSAKRYADQGSFGEPVGRGPLEQLFQQHKVDIAMFSHVRHYERTCPMYQNTCTNKEKREYKGMLNGTIHMVVGGGGAPLSSFSEVQPSWSLVRDLDFGFAKLTAFNHSTLLCEYKRSSNGRVRDSFTITKDYRDILACTVDSCERTTLAP